MTWTVRIYNDATMSSHTDHPVENEAEAYAVVYNEPLPLPANVTLKDPNANNFAIYNDHGMCVFSMPSDSEYGKTLS
jgi:hypothetical protein